ncbi:MAG TPA: PadR family transcriptional regulator [Ktedonobacteraceae bacterium]|jgi:DNA-binding PadR family transcriptional regulator|nr:PadR family transcriptional regulator [Ktedonobacteraceae bacterium]
MSNNDDGERRPPEALLPLTPAVFHILLALADGEKHGYAIMQEVEARTEGAMRMGPGTLYGSIQRMLKDGLIVEVQERADPVHHEERRRYYRLTTFGQRVVQAEARRLEQLIRIAQSKQVLPGFGMIASGMRGGA